MIAGIFHQGSGLGNQLFRYVATRVKATDLGVHFGMLERSDGSGKTLGFKGESFMTIDKGVLDVKHLYFSKFEEKKVVENGVDVRSYDPEWNFIEDNTIIDGEFQDPKYFMHRIDEIRDWLKVEPLEFSENTCVINFRGGEYALYPDLFLPKEYWNLAIKKMREINPNMEFQVHTDDPAIASKFFPKYKIVQDMGLNWRAVRYAPYLILSNSSFGILPAILNENVKKVIAPQYWARYNKKIWAMEQNKHYGKFHYIHHEMDN